MFLLFRRCGFELQIRLIAPPFHLQGSGNASAVEDGHLVPNRQEIGIGRTINVESDVDFLLCNPLPWQAGGEGTRLG